VTVVAILIPNWWQAALVIIGIVGFTAVRHAFRRSRHERAQTAALVAEWASYRRRHASDR
jgi:hypothetical protein